MSNKTAKVAPVQVEGMDAQSEESTKVIQLENTPVTVSQKLQLAGSFTKACKTLETLYTKREAFNVLFYGTGSIEPNELEEILLVPVGCSGYKDEDIFRISNPETLQKVKTFVNLELSGKIEELENQIVNFKL
jgi:hypothetical protein